MISSTIRRFRLLGLLRLVLLALVVQISGSSLALAKTASAIRELVEPSHAGCAATAEPGEAHSPAPAQCFSPDCCSDDQPCGDCLSGCAGCHCTQGSRLMIAGQLALVSQAQSAERVAASAASYASPFTPDLPSIFRPPCA